jgi:hypothetical protein
MPYTALAIQIGHNRLLGSTDFVPERNAMTLELPGQLQQAERAKF